MMETDSVRISHKKCLHKAGIGVFRCWGFMAATTWASPACICPTTQASANPWLLKISSTWSAAAGVQETSRSPEVWSRSTGCAWHRAPAHPAPCGCRTSPSCGPMRRSPRLAGPIPNTGQQRQRLAVDHGGEPRAARTPAPRYGPAGQKPVTSIRAAAHRPAAPAPRRAG